jgi:uncharacterized protein YcbX
LLIALVTMPTISQLTLYPIKSCAGINLDQAQLLETGLHYHGVSDREWMLVDPSGEFLTQRFLPRMALLRPQILPGILRVHAPDMPALDIPLDQGKPDRSARVTVWRHTGQAYEYDAAVAAWFTKALATACRLVRFDPQHPRQVSTTYTDGIQTHTLFSDGYPFLLTSVASLADVNAKLQAGGRTPLPMNRFRANIIVDGVEAFEEDYTDVLEVGDIRIKPVKPCARCPVPSIDQETGEIGPSPLDIMQTYRVNDKVGGGITFGMNAILLAGAQQTLHVGQSCELQLAF